MSCVITILKPEKYQLVPAKKQCSRAEFNKLLDKYADECKENEEEIINSDTNEYEWIDDYFYYFLDHEGNKLNTMEYYEINLAKDKYINKRYNKQLKNLREKFKEYVVETDFLKTKQIVLPCSNVIWYQGWCFTKKLLEHNDSSIYYATERDHMIRLLNQFLKPDPRYDVSEIYEACLENFKDGYIFELAW